MTTKHDLVTLKAFFKTICDYKTQSGDSEGIILKICDYKTQSGDSEGIL